ncbi:MAG: CDP-alcohol phosphatidyltransferase family protein [Desulfomonile tiedjei]|nr:CDP-alcohol phosphatidyltransferase family protein [Desulfomonile tiedjei]
MSSTQKDNPDEAPGGFKPKPREFLNYFGNERRLHQAFAERRTQLISAVIPPFVRLGLAPDTISYIGLALLAGVIIYFIRDPKLATLFLLGHVICDGLDGAFARHAGKASQSGAFTDLVCDQLGMVLVSVMAIFHHMVSPLLGTVYVTLYLIVVVFGVIINVMGIGSRVTITSKYFLYIVYGIWAVWKINLFAPLMSFFSIVMAVEVVVGYLRLKRGLRRKFDAQVRFSNGDLYSGKLNYVLNVSVPIAVLVAIVVWGNIIPLRAMIASPALAVEWKEAQRIVLEDKATEILGIAVRNRRYLILTRDEKQDLEITKVPAAAGERAESFSVPAYLDLFFGTLPVDNNVLLVADKTTRLLLGIDIDASLARKQAVIVFTLPIGWLRLTAMAAGEWNGKKVWLAANYLYTRKTYVIDPELALKKGSLLGGVIASYVNGGFPSGCILEGGNIVEFNRPPFGGVIYKVSLDQAIRGSNLLDLGKTSFAPPGADLLGPLMVRDQLTMVSGDGRVYHLPMSAVMR